MTTYTTLPHQKLIAYQVATQLLVAVRAAQVSDARLREQALRAAKSVCLNIAEASGRQGSADQKRVFGIARGELAEVAAAVEIAVLAGDCAASVEGEVQGLALRLHALLTALIRR